MDAHTVGLEVSGLAKRYNATIDGRQAGLHPISFNLERGKFLTLLGPSGCGKTTTLRCIAGLEQPQVGAIRLEGQPLYDAAANVNMPLNHRNIGMVFQSYAIWPHMTVAQNVAFPLVVARDRSYSRDEIRQMVGQALETVDLAGFQERSATQLSGGQQQRIALARAIVRTPKLLLLDEPLSNLDSKLRDEMRAELKRLQRQLGVTTVYVTHDQSEALELSDVVVVLNQGQVVQMGPPRSIYHEPADAFVAAFMGSTNLFPGRAVAAVDGGAQGKVALTNGLDIVCRFPQAAEAGSQTMVSIRPESVSLRGLDSPPRDGLNRVRGTVISSGFLGHTNRFVVQIGGITMHATTESSTDFDAGAEVFVEFSYADSIALRPGQDAGANGGATR